MQRFVIAAVASLVAATAGAQMYRWVDKDGKVYYTDSPPPSAAGKSVQKSAAAPSAAAAGPVAPYAVQQAAKNFPVVVYTAPNCGQPCSDGKALLASRGVPYSEIAIGQGGVSAEDLKKATGGDTVPVMMVGRAATRGFETDMWNTALDSAGYPRSAPPLSAQAQKAAAAKADPAKADAAKSESAAAKAGSDEPPKPKGKYAPL